MKSSKEQLEVSTSKPTAASDVIRPPSDWPVHETSLLLILFIQSAQSEFFFKKTGFIRLKQDFESKHFKERVLNPTSPAVGSRFDSHVFESKPRREVPGSMPDLESKHRHGADGSIPKF